MFTRTGRQLKTIAAMAGVTRTGFYPKKNRDGTARPGTYQRLAEEFERRVKELQEAGEIVDPRAAQIDVAASRRQAGEGPHEQFVGCTAESQRGLAGFIHLDRLRPGRLRASPTRTSPPICGRLSFHRQEAAVLILPGT